MPKRPSKDEETLWQRAMRGVAPLSEPRVAKPRAEKSASPRGAVLPKPLTPTAKIPAAAALPELARADRRELKGKSFSPRALLDLHGLRQDEAHRALARFIAAARAKGETSVLIVTGKGGPGRESVLRANLPRWLAEPEFKSQILGMSPAHGAHGGDGAFYLRLRKLR